MWESDQSASLGAAASTHARRSAGNCFLRFQDKTRRADLDWHFWGRGEWRQLNPADDFSATNSAGLQRIHRSFRECVAKPTLAAHMSVHFQGTPDAERRFLAGAFANGRELILLAPRALSTQSHADLGLIGASLVGDDLCERARCSARRRQAGCSSVVVFSITSMPNARAFFCSAFTCCSCTRV